MKKFLSLFSLAAVAMVLFGFAPAAHATTFTYNFTYSGTGNYDSGEAVTGNGSLSYDSVTKALTAFTFTDNFTSPTAGASSNTYGLADVSGTPAIVTNGSGALTNITLSTKYLIGTNANYGPVDFVLNYSGTTFDSTSDSNPGAPKFLDGITHGGGGISLATNVAPTPEPSSLLMLGTGILGMAGMVRRKLRRQKPAPETISV